MNALGGGEVKLAVAYAFAATAPMMRLCPLEIEMLRRA